jgi:hypothetical protein
MVVMVIRILALLAFLLASTLAPAQFFRNEGFLAYIRGANFNSTSDQQFALPPQITQFAIDTMIVANCTGDASSAVGGVYDGAGKTGNQVVPASQTYTPLNGVGTIAQISSVSTTLTYTNSATLYLSLSTPQGSAVTCDVFLGAIDLS